MGRETQGLTSFLGLTSLGDWPHPVSLEAAGLLVLGEVGLEREALAALEAGERLVRRVSLNVSPQVALVSEGLVTEVTAEWFLSSVSSDVTLEQPRSGERLATERTLAARGVGPHVHAEGGRAAVLLVAVRAVLHVWVWSVGLPVPSQVGAAGVTLPTVGAGEAGARVLLHLAVCLAATALPAVGADAVSPHVQEGGAAGRPVLLLPSLHPEVQRSVLGREDHHLGEGVDGDVQGRAGAGVGRGRGGGGAGADGEVGVEEGVEDGVVEGEAPVAGSGQGHLGQLLEATQV